MAVRSAFLVVAFLWAGNVVAQTVERPLETVALHRLTGPITLDGLSNEPAWEALPPFPLTMYEPLYRGEQTEHTEIRVGYDNEYLYVAGRMYDSDPSGIRANSLYRDRYSGDDILTVVLDTFNDNENALWFFTTPNEVRLDMAISNDGESGGGQPFGAVNSSWNTYWDVASVRNEEGWFAEMRIPYSSLGFQDLDGRVEMGMIVSRFIARKNETHIYPAIPPNWDLGFAKPSQAQKVTLEGVYSQKPLYITPYVLGGVEQLPERNSAGTGYEMKNGFTGEIGGDLKYSLTSNLTVDLTVNTDFAQVEADDQQVNLTRFSLFFPEKRQFFQERAGIFEFTTGRFDRLFHSRQIGLYEGETVSIIGGARLVGRVGGWDVGLVNMQTIKHNPLDEEVTPLPSENFGVYRLRRNVINPSSYVGGMLTSRLGLNGNYNVAYGLDGIIRVGDQEYLTLKWAQSFDDEEREETYQTMQSGLGRIWFERRGTRGWAYTAAMTWVGPTYNPGVGFVTRTDFYEPFGRLSYGWFFDETSRIRYVQPGTGAAVYFRNTDNSVETAFYWLDASLAMKSGDVYNLELQGNVEDLPDSLEFPENTSVPPGEYEFYTLSGRYNMRTGSLLRVDASAQGGSFYDGWLLQVGLQPTWNISRFLELGAEYQFNRVRFSDRGQAFDVHLGRIRAQIGFNTKISFNAFLQINSSDNVVSANVRFRYNFRENNDLWIVYNQGNNLDRRRELPHLPKTEFRTLVLKYTYTFGS